METTSVSQAWADNPQASSNHSSFHMIDVGEKLATRRIAEAQGEILLSPAAYSALKNYKNPKGNVLALAEVAGIMAAKRTSDLIPLCHPLPLHSVHLKFELLDADYIVKVFCEARTTAQTGVEMEAICGVNGALLTIYDLSKAVDPVIEIKNVRLNFKQGGKSGVWQHPHYKPSRSRISEDSTQEKLKLPLQNITVSVLTVSDRVSRNESVDKSGPYLLERLRLEGAKIIGHAVVSDDVDPIQKQVIEMIASQKPQLLITTGGTGLSPRDVTPDALEAISSRKISGFGELLRLDGSQHIKTAWLSRSMACMIDQTLVIALPGSQNACREAVDVLAPLLKHALHTISGGHHGPIS